jgi:hypothetical protein
MKYFSLGNTPFGQSGHSGQVKPSPADEIYPPINMREYKTIRVASERYFKANTILL